MSTVVRRKSVRTFPGGPGYDGLVKDVYAAFCERVRALMAAAGNMSISELSRRGGPDRTGLTQILNGNRRPTLPMLEGIAKGLGVEIADLFLEGPRPVTEEPGPGVAPADPWEERLLLAFRGLPEREQGALVARLELQAEAGPERQAFGDRGKGEVLPEEETWQNRDGGRKRA